MSDDLKPWDQQPNEPSRPFAAFQCYRDMGASRTQAAVSRKLYGKDGQHCCDKYSAKYNWVARAAAYDRYMDQQVTAKRAEEIAKMGERHTTIAMMYISRAVERLKRMNPETLTNDQLLRWFEVGVKIERLSRGEATENVKTEHTGNINNGFDLTKLSDDEFRTIYQIINRSNTEGSLGEGCDTPKE